jgi:hypothetical protein
MLMSRRTFLASSAIMASGSRLVVTQDGRTVIEVLDLTLVQNLDTFVGASVSHNTFCEVEILNPDRNAIKAAKWVLESRAPNGEFLSTLGSGNSGSKYGVRITMVPSDRTVPSVSVAVIQPGVASARGRGQSGGASMQAGINQAANMARRARFVVDPARTPGYFAVALPTDGSVQLKIWRGEEATGSPLDVREFNKLPQGEQKIPWDLKAGGVRVKEGRYTALLVCMPENTALKPTNLISYFAVLA